MKTSCCPQAWLKMFKAVGDPVRQDILDHINENEPVNATFLVNAIDLSQPTVSHHLKILLEAEIITATKKGKETLYAINEPIIAACCMGFLKKFCPEKKKARLKKCKEALEG